MDFVVVRGTLRDDAGTKHVVVGVICPNIENKSGQRWVAGMVRKLPDLRESRGLGIRDRNACEYGYDSSPLAVHQYMAIGGR